MPRPQNFPVSGALSELALDLAHHPRVLVGAADAGGQGLCGFSDEVPDLEPVFDLEFRAAVAGSIYIPGFTGSHVTRRALAQCTRGLPGPTLRRLQGEHRARILGVTGEARVRARVCLASCGPNRGHFVVTPCPPYILELGMMHFLVTSRWVHPGFDQGL